MPLSRVASWMWPSRPSRRSEAVPSGATLRGVPALAGICDWGFSSARFSSRSAWRRARELHDVAHLEVAITNLRVGSLVVQRRRLGVDVREDALGHTDEEVRCLDVEVLEVIGELRRVRLRKVVSVNHAQNPGGRRHAELEVEVRLVRRAGELKRTVEEGLPTHRNGGGDEPRRGSHQLGRHQEDSDGVAAKTQQHAGAGNGPEARQRRGQRSVVRPGRQLLLRRSVPACRR